MAYTDVQMRAFTQIAYFADSEKYQSYCIEHGTSVAPLSEMLSPEKQAELVLLGITESELNSWKMSGVYDTNDTNGFFACVVETGTDEAVVAFRGSEDMQNLDHLVHDWVEADLGLLNSTVTKQQNEIRNFFEKDASMLKKYKDLSMTGHSLGGNLAEYATIISDEYGLDKNIKQCMSLDGPGFSDEFISKHASQIQKMSDKMTHARWSFVGKLLNDLPGVEYFVGTVSNEANMVDDEEYNSATRHSTKFCEVEEDGSFHRGTSDDQDALTRVASVISKGIDKMPDVLGNAFSTFVSCLWIDAIWMKDKMFDQSGRLTGFGIGVVTAAAAFVAVVGPVAAIASIASIVVIALAFVLVAAGIELLAETIEALSDFICRKLEDAYHWTAEKISQLFNSINEIINDVSLWFKESFNSGYKYAVANSSIYIDINAFFDCGRRLEALYNRVDGVNNLLRKILLDPTMTLEERAGMQGASWAFPYSGRLRKCASYLFSTAERFDGIERKLSK